MDLVLKFEELLSLPQSKKIFGPLELHFVSYYSSNQLKVLIRFPIFHYEVRTISELI